MKDFIVSQIIFIVILCLLLVLREIILYNKVVDIVLLAVFLISFVAMVFTQSYLKAIYEIKDALANFITILSIGLFFCVYILIKVLIEQSGRWKHKGRFETTEKDVI